MSANSQRQHQCRRAAFVVVLAGTAALSLQALLTQHPWYGCDDGGVIFDDAQQISVVEETKIEEDHFHDDRIPTSNMAERYRKLDDEILAIPDDNMLSSISEDGKASELSPAKTITTTTVNTPLSHAQLIDATQPLPLYTISDAVSSSKMYERCFALFVYDPDDDAFYGFHSKRHYWVSGCHKLLGSIKNLAFLLRKNFPERFQGNESEELVIPVSSGDYPGVRISCIDGSDDSCSHQYKYAPILHFGSVFRHPLMFPSIIAMPMPSSHHLLCFKTWTTSNTVCEQLRAVGEIGNEIGLEWGDLIPQVVWRGTDFSFLARVPPILIKPQFQERLINWSQHLTMEDKTTKKTGGQPASDAATKKRRHNYVRKLAAETKTTHVNKQIRARFTKATAVESLMEQYAHLLPRWKAALLTADAEVKASSQPTATDDAQPWADMRFSNYIHSGHKANARGAKDYREWESIGLDITGDHKSLEALARYKYHVDLGGGGGTTWSGTIEKLAMPGLLFHHFTPTKDYVHDWMTPWVHYVPVSSDLLDLKEKFDWAESHPIQAKKIADEGTKLMRFLTSPEGYAQMYQKNIVEPLRRVIEAYQPVSIVYRQTHWRTWREVLQEIEGDDVWFSLIKCSGISVRSCEIGEIPDNKYTKGASRQYMAGHGK